MVTSSPLFLRPLKFFNIVFWFGKDDNKGSVCSALSVLLVSLNMSVSKDFEDFFPLDFQYILEKNKAKSKRSLRQALTYIYSYQNFCVLSIDLLVQVCL